MLYYLNKIYSFLKALKKEVLDYYITLMPKLLYFIMKSIFYLEKIMSFFYFYINLFLENEFVKNKLQI
jgi:hypothetical protein